MGILVLLGALILFAAADMDDSELISLGSGILILVGFLMSPNIILYAIKDNKDWRSKAFKYKREESFEKKIYKEEIFHKLEDASPYHNKIVFGVVREAVLNFGALIILIALALIGLFNTFLFGSGRDSSKAFAYITAILVFLIPSFVYNLTCSIYRLRTVLRREYFACRTVVSEVYKFEISIMGKNNTYKFSYCRCLGIRAKDVCETNAVLVFVPDEVYLIPYNEWTNDLQSSHQ